MQECNTPLIVTLKSHLAQWKHSKCIIYVCTRIPDCKQHKPRTVLLSKKDTTHHDVMCDTFKVTITLTTYDTLNVKLTQL